MATSSILLGRCFTAATCAIVQCQAIRFASIRTKSALIASQQSYNHHQHDYTTSNYLSKQYGLLAAAGAKLAATVMNKRSNAKCWGIVGVVGTKDGSARDFLIVGLTILKNRGYDSAGIATKSDMNPSLVIIKYASKGKKANGLNLVNKRSQISKGHNIGIAHTCWATNGDKTNENAHPHTNSSGHNGTINNCSQLCKELQGRGHVFTSQTDTEVIAKLTGEYYEKNGDKNLKKAVEQTLAPLGET
jgi:glucosamine--fructose-6-phosphate aminotransferase (isomerizing)